MKHEVTAPRDLADLVAELTIGGALRVSTRLPGDDGRGPGALTVVYLDGDVTTSVTRACIVHPEADGLLLRHLQELRRIDDLLRRGAAGIVRIVALVGSAITVLGVAIDAATGHSWQHILAVLAAFSGAGATAFALVRRFATRLLVRSARRAIARRAARPTGAP
jgi:Kef-type K+ transport system membrane component KefB